MATIKSYTDLEQSKKLAEILPIESADMHYVLIDTEEDKYGEGLGKYIGILPHYPCWSLAALLDILAKETHNIDEDGHVVLSSYKGNWWNVSPINCVSGEIRESSNPVDAVFEMVVCLKENEKI